MKVRNAVIMAAGFSSRFVPLSFERPKALLPVRGEIMIERQIRQLHEVGIREVYVVTGYLKEQFRYLEQKLDVKLIENPDYQTRNNHSSIYAARSVLGDSYVCSGDNYFTVNPFSCSENDSFYAALYSDGPTSEWCIETDEEDRITGVTIGGSDCWYMLGHTFWSKLFCDRFLQILESEYMLPETAGKLWESIFLAHISSLPMRIKHFPNSAIWEFDSLDELRAFDPSYIEHTNSRIMGRICDEIHCMESELHAFQMVRNGKKEPIGFRFLFRDKEFEYLLNGGVRDVRKE